MLCSLTSNELIEQVQEPEEETAEGSEVDSAPVGQSHILLNTSRHLIYVLVAKFSPVRAMLCSLTSNELIQQVQEVEQKGANAMNSKEPMK